MAYPSTANWDRLQAAQRVDLTSSSVRGGRDINVVAAGGDIYFNTEQRERTVRQQKQDCRTLLRWISKINFKAIQRDIFTKVAKDTGKWFLHHEYCLEWVAGKRNLLWGVGIAGAGKTFLSSVIIKNLQCILHGNPLGLVVFAYCRFEDAYTELDILCSLLRQVAEKCPPVYDFLEALHSDYRGVDDDDEERLTQQDVFEALKLGFQQFTRTFIIIDGLDELTDEVWFNLVRDLQGELSDPSVSVFLTSRDIRLVPGLKPDLHIRPDQLEMNSFIRTELRRLPKLAESLDVEGLELTVADKIEKKCQGMFLLARLHLDSLRNVKTVKELLYEIEQMPTGIAQMYRVTLARIGEQPADDRDLAYRALVWVTHARRSVTSKELRFALAATVNCTSLDRDSLISESTLLAVCYGLLTIEGEHKHVRLSHYTAHSFLVSQVKPPFITPHWTIATSCISYLSSLTAGGLRWPEDVIRLNNFQLIYDLGRYSSAFLGFHLRSAMEQQPECPLPQHVIAFFRRSVSMPLQSSEMIGKWDSSSCDWGSAVHFAAKHGILPLIGLLPHPLDAESRLGITPLMYAAGNGDIAMTRRLLSVGVDVNQVGSHRSSTALSRACMNGHVEVVKVLLNTPNINVNTRYGDVGILHAVIRDSLQDTDNLFRLLSLLSESQEVNFSQLDSRSRTVFHIAAERGVGSRIFGLLIGRAASLLNAMDCDDRTALDVAEDITNKYRREEITSMIRGLGATNGAPARLHWHSLAANVPPQYPSRPEPRFAASLAAAAPQR